MTGRIVNWGKSYSWVRGSDGDDYYAPAAELGSDISPSKQCVGMEVRFDLQPIPGKRPRAINVSRTVAEPAN